jgi:hypothetical protein
MLRGDGVTDLAATETRPNIDMIIFRVGSPGDIAVHEGRRIASDLFKPSMVDQPSGMAISCASTKLIHQQIRSLSGSAASECAVRRLIIVRRDLH